MKTSAAGVDTRQVVETADNYGPQINIVAWTTMVFTILAIGTRLAIKYHALRRLWWDDALVVTAMVRQYASEYSTPVILRPPRLLALIVHLHQCPVFSN